MKKLSLDLDQLAVESFDTTAEAARSRGTVRGHVLTDTTCGQFICDCPTGSGESCQADLCGSDVCESADCGSINCPTAWHTCNKPSCFYSCPSTCVEGDTCFC